MALWFAALLGLLQGLTEFIPVSSTAHLRLAPALLGQPDPGAAFTAVIQLGSLVAVIAYLNVSGSRQSSSAPAISACGYIRNATLCAERGRARSCACT